MPKYLVEVGYEDVNVLDKEWVVPVNDKIKAEIWYYKKVNGLVLEIEAETPEEALRIAKEKIDEVCDAVAGYFDCRNAKFVWKVEKA